MCSGGLKRWDEDRIKDPLYTDVLFGTTPATFILPFEAPKYDLSTWTVSVRLKPPGRGTLDPPSDRTN